MKENESITYNDILNLWLESKKDIKLQSILHYENIIHYYLMDTIGKMKIKDLKKEEIELLFQKSTKSPYLLKRLCFI